MMDIIGLLKEEDTRGSRFLSQLSKKDFEFVWGAISFYIERQITLQKGVHLPGLGTFTFSQQNLDIGHKFIRNQQPIFIVAGKLAGCLGLKQDAPLAAATHLPVVQLNFAAVSQDSPFSREVVEGCFRETLELLYGALASQKHVSLPFKGVGILSFNNNKVQMKFNRDFLNAMSRTVRLQTGLNLRADRKVSSIPNKPQLKNSVLQLNVSLSHKGKAIGKDRGSLSAKTHQRRNAKEVAHQKESKSHQTLQPAKLKAVTMTEELNPNPLMEAMNKHIPTDPIHQKPLNIGEHFLKVHPSCHTHAGQELCHLCIQRAQRNTPVYLREQQEAQERAQEKLLLLHRHRKEEQDMAQEEAKLAEQRERAKQTAALNLRTSEKKQKTSLPVLPRAFLFLTRRLTPPKWIQQHHYRSDLQSQIERRQKQEALDRQNSFLAECLAQVQLTQETALHNAQQHQQKQERIKTYKEALDVQVEKTRCLETPDFLQENSPFRNRCETPLINAENRERAHELFETNLNAATLRKNEELQRRLVQLEKERRMLRHTKKELIMDHINHFEKKNSISKSLEDDWRRNMKLKHEREEEERRHRRCAGQLLVDKLAEYRRCCQCKRKTSNCGQTNIWKDSHYPAGTQFMV
ncbi:Coiled-coil domain-containing protein 81 [Oryzias melastigma]|uniref:Coiled-coil domain-containing protein 81 n=1 Tax=Oryzias melastigma TaxID=30732 RepID=A0A834CNS1_ORYME|nr:Coiled-coil domain-containing protein 81 [Oryzias melastigma]